MPGFQVSCLPAASSAGLARPVLLLFFMTGNVCSHPSSLPSHTHLITAPASGSRLPWITSGSRCSGCTWHPVRTSLGWRMWASVPRIPALSPWLVLWPLKWTAECLVQKRAFALFLVIPRSFRPVSHLPLSTSLQESLLSVWTWHCCEHVEGRERQGMTPGQRARLA